MSVDPSGVPVFAKPSKGGTQPTDFCVRVGNATKQLHGTDFVHYEKTHW